MSGGPWRREAHLSHLEVRRALDCALARKRGGDDEALTRLAWRPAWAIRSRRGAWGPFVAMIRDAFARRR